jgi:hypothetical protein
MPYTVASYDRIQHITDKLPTIPKGKFITITTKDSVTLERTRATLYAYLNHVKIKPWYTIKRMSNNSLTVTRVDHLECKIEESDSYEAEQTFILDNLLNVQDEDQALEIIREKLPRESWLSTINEWRRVCAQ